MALAAEQRRALEMLAGSPNGCTESTLRAHGFKVGSLAGLVRAGLAVASGRSLRRNVAHASTGTAPPK